jgi:hypothetical protein
VGALAAGSAQAAASAANPLANPKTNRALPLFANSTGTCVDASGGGLSCQSPCYPDGHFRYNASKNCTEVLLAAVNQAQTAEHLDDFTLPSNYFGLSPTKQLFVLVNLERVSRGVPPIVGLSPYLDSSATRAAERAEDPGFQSSYGPVRLWVPPGGGTYAYAGTWAGGSVNAVAAVFGWLYDDGWSGRKATWNYDCTSPTASGCWGHRDQLLGESTGTRCTDCVAGSGYASPGGRNWQESYTFLLVRPVEFPTPLDFTWDGDVVPYLTAGWEKAHAP